MVMLAMWTSRVQSLIALYAMQSTVSISPGVRRLVGLGDWMERGFRFHGYLRPGYGVAQTTKTDPPLTRRALSGYGWFPKLLPELVELMGIEPMTS
jgi:hypothetical protein